MKAELRDRLRLGRAGPVSRRLARAITKTAPVRRVDWIAYALIGHPRGRDVTVTARRYGATFKLHLGDDVDRLLYLDTYERLALRDVLGVVRPGDLVIDIGANVGLYSLAAAAAGARVHAFEPVPATAARLRTSLALNPELTDRVTVHGEGLSDEPGTLTLFTESLDGYSGHASAHLPTEAQVESIEVPMNTLDAATADLEGPVRLVKVDVEGHEPAVLDGGREFFERMRPEYLFVEIEEDHLVRAGSSGAAFYQRILDLGYEAQGGYTLHHGLWPHTTPSHDEPPFPAGRGQSLLFRAR
jgi:FkbM family methyltransferase